MCVTCNFQLILNFLLNTTFFPPSIFFLSLSVLFIFPFEGVKMSFLEFHNNNHSLGGVRRPKRNSTQPRGIYLWKDKADFLFIDGIMLNKVAINHNFGRLLIDCLFNKVRLINLIFKFQNFQTQTPMKYLNYLFAHPQTTYSHTQHDFCTRETRDDDVTTREMKIYVLLERESRIKWWKYIFFCNKFSFVLLFQLRRTLCVLLYPYPWWFMLN